MKSHLEPLAIASNIVQSAICRLDEVLFTFGWLYFEFNKLNNPADQQIKKAVLASIEKRWDKCDQEVFLAAAILNPFVATSAFKPHPFLNFIGLIGLFTRLYKRFYGNEPPPDQMMSNVNDYFNNAGPFYGFPDMKKAVLIKATSEVCSPVSNKIYSQFLGP
jgi:hypothetical protein